jgi:hypothetical protein
LGGGEDVGPDLGRGRERQRAQSLVVADVVGGVGTASDDDAEAWPRQPPETLSHTIEEDAAACGDEHWLGLREESRFFERGRGLGEGVDGVVDLRKTRFVSSGGDSTFVGAEADQLEVGGCLDRLGEVPCGREVADSPTAPVVAVLDQDAQWLRPLKPRIQQSDPLLTVDQAENVAPR